MKENNFTYDNEMLGDHFEFFEDATFFYVSPFFWADRLQKNGCVEIAHALPEALEETNDTLSEEKRIRFTKNKKFN